MNKLRVLCYGLGPIGLKAAALAATKECLQIVGALDIDPGLAGKDLGELAGTPQLRGLVVSGDAAAVLRGSQPDIAIHCTSSFLPKVEAQLVDLARAGIDVISSTEELLWPRLQHPDIAARIDAAARAAGTTILGTGVNPGFVMDALPAFASAVCHDVQKIVCRRYVDASKRRLPFQRKIGAGLTPAAFGAKLAAGGFGHIGLRESMAFLGAAIGFTLDRIEQTVEPILAEHRVKTEFLEVQPGQVAGIWNKGHGWQKDTLRVEMDLRMYVGAADPLDEAVLEGTPRLHLRLPGGTHGDLATAAMLVNGIPGVVAAGPGLKTMLEVPLPHLIR